MPREPRPFIRYFGSHLASLPEGFAGRLLWQYAGTLLGVGAGFAYTIVVARFLGASQFGLLALAIASTSVISQFFQADMRDFLIREMTGAMENSDSPHARNVFTRGIAINVLAAISYCAVVWVFSDFIARIWSFGTELATIIPLAALNVAFQTVLTDGLIGALRVFNRVRDLAILQTGAAIARLAVTWFLLLQFHVGLLGILAAGAACYFVTFLFMLAAAARQLSRLVPSTARVSPFGFFNAEQRKFVFHNYLTYLYAIPARDLDINILGLFATTEAVGIYRMAKNFVALLWTVTDPIHIVLYPEYARLWSRRAQDQIRALTLRLMAALAGLALLMFVAGCLVVPPVIVAFAGQAFAGSAPLYIYMAISILFWLPQKWLPPLLLAAGRADVNMKAAFVSGIAGLASYTILGRLYGASGVAWSYTLNMILLVALQLAWGWRVGVVGYALGWRTQDRDA